jgi:predicted N-acetyltransferase YhbS
MMNIRAIRADERERVLDLLDEWISRDFFRRYFEYDPAYSDELCLVAEDDGRFVSTLQIWPKTVRLEGREVSVGGIGNVFTTEDYRSKGVASLVLRRAIEVMESEKFDLSLLFASRLTFYAQFGWGSHRRLLGAVTPPAATTTPGSEVKVRDFDPRRDLGVVMEIYEAYSGVRSGAVARDRRYWEGQLRYAGNPHETFLVAEGGGRVVAYVRFVDLYDVYTVMEHGFLAGQRAALLSLLDVVAERTRDRGFLLLHLGAEPDLAAALSARGFGVSEVEDVFWMWRVISPDALARKLGVRATEVEQPEFLDRVLPYHGSVYWTSDRF